MAHQRVMEEKFSTERNEFTKETILSNLNESRKKGEFCDVKIIVNTHVYPVHKCVLGIFSPYFKVTSLFNACSDFLKKRINAENCLDIYTLADRYSCANLKNKARDVCLEHFCTLSQSSVFLELDPDTLVDIISSDCLNVESEELVLNAVLCWIRHKETERTESLPKMLAHVHLALLGSDFLYDHVETVEVIKESPTCMSLVNEAYRFIALPKRRRELESDVTRPREELTVEGAVILPRRKRHEAGGSRDGYDCLFITPDGKILGTLPSPPFKPANTPFLIGFLDESIYK